MIYVEKLEIILLVISTQFYIIGLSRKYTKNFEALVSTNNFILL